MFFSKKRGERDILMFGERGLIYGKKRGGGGHPPLV